MKKTFTLILGYSIYIICWVVLLSILSNFAIGEINGYDDRLLGILISAFAILNIIYLTKIRFWKIDGNFEYSILEQQSLIIKKKIEKKELENKLSNLEK